MMILRIFLIIFIYLVFSQTAFAKSDYVLPYPSSMPGSFFYKMHLVYESFSKYWYFGDFGQFDYNLKMSDKYLVEAKTLFEYRQYLLGDKALSKSDKYFVNILPSLISARKNGKNILQKRALLNEASEKHIEVLREIMEIVPSTFTWEPEKSLPTTLNLKDALSESIELRKENI
jgi:hypothetical protein